MMRGSHALKFGLQYGHNWKVQPSGANYAGAYNFGDSSTNPLDTGFGFANAAAASSVHSSRQTNTRRAGRFIIRLNFTRRIHGERRSV